MTRPRLAWVASLLVTAGAGAVTVTQVARDEIGGGSRSALPGITPVGNAAVPSDLAAPPTFEREDLQISPFELDLGQLRSGQVATANVILRNHGRRAVRLSTTTRCGCVETSFQPSDATLGPAEERVLVVRFSLTNRAGPTSESIRVLADGVEFGRVVVSATVVGGFELARERGGFDAVIPGEPPEAMFILRGSLDLPPWRPIGVRFWREETSKDLTDATAVIESLPTRTGEGLTYRIRASLPPVAVPGRQRVWVRVRTDGPESEWPATPVSYDVYESVRPAIGTARLGVVGESTSRPARIRMIAAVPSIHFTVRSAEVLEEGTRSLSREFAALVGQDDIGWFVEVSYVGNDPSPRSLRGVLIVETDRTDRPRIEIPVLGTIPMRTAAIR